MESNAQNPVALVNWTLSCKLSVCSRGGRLPGRPCDTWVFPASDQVMPCFLVDELALPQAICP
eukprot:6391437-Alexandrium_andersonii.AAC.1